MKVEIEFTEELLGTRAGNKELACDYQAAKHPEQVQEDELAAIENIDETIAKSSTVFDRDDAGRPFLWDYQFKGFFKEACLAMIETDTLTKEELKKVRLTNYLYKRTIDKQVFVCPRMIFLDLPEGVDCQKLEFCERPLRGQTMKGERISLARSEVAPSGTKIVLEIKCMNKKHEPFIEQWLTYGALSGMGQWRNSGKGRFVFRILDE